MLRLMDILQIMCIGTADYIAGFKIRMLPPDPVQVFKIMELSAGKCASGRYESEVGDKAGGTLVHMSRIGDTVTGSRQRKYVITRDGCRIDEQILHSTCYFIFNPTTSIPN